MFYTGQFVYVLSGKEHYGADLGKGLIIKVFYEGDKNFTEPCAKVFFKEVTLINGEKIQRKPFYIKLEHLILDGRFP